jgi:hypothetical protein
MSSENIVDKATIIIYPKRMISGAGKEIFFMEILFFDKYFQAIIKSKQDIIVLKIMALFQSDELNVGGKRSRGSNSIKNTAKKLLFSLKFGIIAFLIIMVFCAIN